MNYLKIQHINILKFERVIKKLKVNFEVLVKYNQNKQIIRGWELNLILRKSLHLMTLYPFNSFYNPTILKSGYT